MKIRIDTLRKRRGDNKKFGLLSVEGYHFFFCNELLVAKARLKDTMRRDDGKVFLFWEVERSELMSSKVIESWITGTETKESHNATGIKNYFCYKHDSCKYKEEIPYRLEIIINTKRIKAQ